MLQMFNDEQERGENEFRQRVADQNIQSIEQRQEEIQHAKNGFIGMLAGIIVGGVVGWLFLGPAENINKEKVIPVIRRPITPAKVQPNDPGGMEIDNLDREIYHIVDNTEKKVKEVNVITAPEMPDLVIENTISSSENLIEDIEDDNSLGNMGEFIENNVEENVRVANAELSSITTNSAEKVIIPQKIKDIDVKLQNNIKTEASLKDADDVKITQEKIVQKLPAQKSLKAAKGTWYAQIIASSSRQTVETLWRKLSDKHTFLKNYSHEVEEITAANGNTLYRLKVGAFKTRQEAETLAGKLKQNQISSIIKQN